MSTLTKPRKSFTMVLRLGLPLAKAVPHYAIGILSRGYPAPFGEKRFAAKAAIDKYGQDLFITLENIYAEVLRTQHEATIRVTWDDGKPEVKVEKRHLIILPGRN